MTNDLFSAAVWEDAWRNDSETSLSMMKRAGIDFVHAFDHRAKLFNEQSFNEEGRQRTKRIMNWLESRGVTLAGASILDIGAASGVFSVPFAANGAQVTSLEPNLPLLELLKENRKAVAGGNGTIDIVTTPFEEIDTQGSEWRKAFDLVFVSMCPVIHDWTSVEKVLSCARKFCYISMMAGPREHSLMNEIYPLLTDKPRKQEHLDMAYLLQLLYIKGYAYESVVTKEFKTAEVSREAALKEVMSLATMYKLPADERSREVVIDYLERTYPTDKVVIRQGGRFGKVLIRLEDESMYAG